jgi:hypothetical protein
MTITINDRNTLFWQTDWKGFDWQNLLMKLSALSLKAKLTEGIS